MYKCLRLFCSGSWDCLNAGLAVLGTASSPFIGEKARLSTDEAAAFRLL